MSYTYSFKVVYKSGGLCYSPVNPPVCKIIDVLDEVLVDNELATPLYNATGVYIFLYTSELKLDLISIFHTDDILVDQQDLSDYTPMQITTDIYDIGATVSTTHILINNLAPTIWTYGNRELTTPLTVNQYPSITAEKLTILTYDDNAFSLTSVPDENDIFFTVKGDKKLDDAHSIIQVTKLDGLISINNRPISDYPILTPADASLMVDGEGNLIISITSLASSLLNSTTNVFGDVKTKDMTGRMKSVYNFYVDIVDTVTHTI